MAITHVTGTVTRVFYNGKGAEVTEQFEIRGETIKKRWTAWFETEHGLTENQEVTVSGMHSDVVDEWTDKESNVRHSVKRSLNKARIKSGEAASANVSPSQAVRAQEPEPWATAAQGGTQAFDVEVPF